MRLAVVILAASARLVVADTAHEQKLARLAALGPSGLPALCGRAQIGMTERELAKAWPAWDPDQLDTVEPLFDADGHVRAIMLGLSPTIEPTREFAVLEQVWGTPAFASDHARIWLWPERHLRGLVSAKFAPTIERYMPLADLDLDARLAVAGMTLGDAKRTLGGSTVVSHGYVDVDFAASEYGTVKLKAHVVDGKLADVSLHVVFPPGAMPRVLDELRARNGPFIEADHRHWRGKRQLVLEAGQFDDFGELTVTRAGID
ncbi:MAG TPA: hypothetical protein VGG28_17100 [Kofleriaceae bacterium]